MTADDTKTVEELTVELARVKNELEAKTRALAKYEDEVKRQARSLAAQTPEKVRLTASGTAVEPESTKLWYIVDDHVYDSWEMALVHAKSPASVSTVYSFAQVVNILRERGYDHYVPRFREDSCYMKRSGQKIYRVYVDGACFRNGQPGAQGGVGVWFGNCNPMNVSEPLEGPVQTSQRAQLAAILKAYEIIARLNNGLCYDIYTESVYALNCVRKWNETFVDDEGESVADKDVVERILELRKEKSCSNVFLKLAQN